jgi:hypothetical protein
MSRDVRHVLHRRDPICRNRDFAAGVCFASRLFAVISPPVRSRLRRVGYLHAARIFDFVIGAARATATNIFVGAAAGTAFVSSRVKRMKQIADELK